MRAFFFTAFFTVYLTPFAQTTIAETNGKWLVENNGEPFPIKGATFGFDADTANYDKHFRELQWMGVNSIRTWGTTSSTPLLLDAAHRHGIKVMLGIWMRHGRPGMEADDSFDYLTDTAGKTKMYEDALETVEKYKDHPALLMWGIGNEVYLNMATDDEKKVYSKLLEKICKKIQKLDPNHPVASVEAWTFGIKWWEKYVPSLDVYGINTYGGGASVIDQELIKLGAKKPYVITEYGVMGEWDIQKDKNGVVPEPSDQEKFNAIVNGYNDWIKPKLTCLGVYVFHYSDDFTHLSPWLFTHVDGKKRPQYWAIREAYTGEKPINNVPSIEKFQLTGNDFRGEDWHPVELAVTDIERDDLRVQFYYNHREGSRKRRDQILPLHSRGNLSSGFEIKLPKENGGVKIYAMVADSYDNLGIWTTNISIKDEDAAELKFLVPKVELPFEVYKDAGNLPYTFSGYMGNYDAMEVDFNHSENVHSGETAVKISYSAVDNWFGLGYVDPPNDWGDMLGGYNIEGAKTFSFWARASRVGVRANMGFGLIKPDNKFYDTAIKMKERNISTEWTKFTYDVRDLDLSCIRSGFVIFSNGIGTPFDIYIDDIVFE
ncbi:MAG: hypothetical protein MK086_08075 [Flavobacteriales bacterium]|nr:hypothetical protein [Flavobacteriales bacterium]